MTAADPVEFCATGQCGGCVTLDSNLVPSVTCLLHGVHERGLTHVGTVALPSLAAAASNVLRSRVYASGSEVRRKRLWEMRLPLAYRWTDTGSPLFATDVRRDIVALKDSPDTYSRLGDAGVYPYFDETTALLRHLPASTLRVEARIVELFAGAGVTSLVIAARFDRPVLLVDVNARGIGLAHYNFFVNDIPHLAQFVCADASRADWLTALPDGELSIIGNPPFSPWPVAPPLGSRAWFGGQTGTDILAGAILALSGNRASRFSFLTYSLSGDSRVEVVERLARLGAEEVTWAPLSGQPMWRVGGRKRLVSPVPLSATVECALKPLPAQTAFESRRVWTAWVAAMQRTGFTHVELGIVCGSTPGATRRHGPQ